MSSVDYVTLIRQLKKERNNGQPPKNSVPSKPPEKINTSSGRVYVFRFVRLLEMNAWEQVLQHYNGVIPNVYVRPGSGGSGYVVDENIMNGNWRTLQNAFAMGCRNGAEAVVLFSAANFTSDRNYYPGLPPVATGAVNQADLVHYARAGVDNAAKDALIQKLRELRIFS